MGYLLGRASGDLLRVRVDVPLLLVLSVIPDVDLLFSYLVEHRGPMHSVAIMSLAFLPLFAIWRQKAIPYYIATAQHSLIGDFIGGGGVQLFWPITTRYYGVSQSIASATNVMIEWSMFVAALLVMWKANDITRLLQPHASNLLLTIPTFTVLLPALLGVPLRVPASLMLPHLIFLAGFLTSIVLALMKFQVRKFL